MQWKDLKVPVVAIWGDLQSPEQLKVSQKLAEEVDFNIYTATSVALHGLKSTKPYIYFWVPKDKTVFFNPKNKRDIDVSFVGTLRHNRKKVIDYLIKHGIRVLVKGGDLSTKEYSGILQRSRISLNFNRSGWLPVITARVFEITSCGAMLLEEAGPETAKLFVPMKDYVPYFSKQDLLKKIQYYLSHNQKREAIANNGYCRVSRDYSARRFWQLVLAMIKGDRKKSTVVNLLELKDWKLKLLDYLFRNQYWSLICYYLDRYATAIS
ncbi:MAG: glycosyltransferase [Candidatus Beckwithbacteria bacterium]